MYHLIDKVASSEAERLQAQRKKQQYKVKNRISNKDMLPLQQAREVCDSVIEYIKATFRFKENAQKIGTVYLVKPI